VSNADKIFDEIIGAPKVRNPELRRMIDERMAKGGLIKKMAKAFDLPPASAAQKTQIPGTEPTYRKAKDILDREKPEGRTLDYGSGLGIGSRVLGAESFEPFPREGVTPTFIKPEDIPTEAFDRLVNLNMLNVVPRDVRDAAVENIGRVMRPGGMGLVTTRGKDVMKATGEPGPEANSIITSIGTYQKGFTPEELREYLKYILGSDFDIGRLNLGPAGAVVRKKGMKRGGRVKSEQFAAADTGKVEMKAPQGGKGAEALMTAAETVVPFVGAAKSALEGNYQQAMLEAGLDVAGGPLAKGLGAAAPMLAGIFIGPNAKTWSKRAAKEFEKLEKAGVSNEEAFKKTGTFRSPDGSLRQEISDKPSALRRERVQALDEESAVVRGRANMEADKLRQAFKDGKLTKEEAQAEWEKIQPALKAESDAINKQRRAASRLAYPDEAVPLGKTLYHPEAFKAYPDLRDLLATYAIRPDKSPEGFLARLRGQQGWTKGAPWELFAQGPTTESARNIMLHEMQHGIQELEDFGRGSNSSLAVSDMLPSGMTENDYIQQLRGSMGRMESEQDAIRKALGPMSAEDFNIQSPRFPQVAEHLQLTKDIEGTRDAIEGIIGGRTFPAYQRSAGEAEARAVQKRMGYGPERLREIFPLSSYDVPLDQLIVKRGYKEGGEVKAADGGFFGKNMGRGMAGLTRSRQPLDPREVQAMFLDVPAAVGVPFAEAGAEYLRGNVEDAEFSAAIDAALTGVPVVGMAAKPAYRAVKSGIQKAAPAAREAARGALESAMESGAIVDPRMSVVKPAGGQWLKTATRGPLETRRYSGAVTPEYVDARRTVAEDWRRMAGENPTRENIVSSEQMDDMLRQSERELAVNQWIDSNLQNYVRKQMGTPEDPIRKLAEQGILHMPYQETGLLKGVAGQRFEAGFPMEGMATTDLGRMWENMSDREIKAISAGRLRDPDYITLNSRKASDLWKSHFDNPADRQLTAREAEDIRNFGKYAGRSSYETLMERNPWLSKLDPETPIYDIPQSWDAGQRLGFDHVIDVLKEDMAAGRIRPDQLSKMSVEQAVRRTAEYDAERAAAMAKAAAAESMKGMTVAQEFDDGFRMVQLDRPGQFAKESDRMGHSVRGYEPREGSEDWVRESGDSGYSSYGHGGWDAIKGGEAKVFSLRDANNNPHVTIEVSAREFGKPPYEKAVENLKKAGYDENQMAKVLYENGYIDESGNVLPDVPSITQIKGKQNAAPKEEYLPMIQKFIRDGNYVVSGDLRNAGLIDTKSPNYLYRPKKRFEVPSNTPRYITESEFERLQETGKFTPDDHLK